MALNHQRIWVTASLAVDCCSLDYVSSAGLRVFMIMRKACQGAVTLTSPNEYVTEIIEQTGFDTILTIA